MKTKSEAAKIRWDKYRETVRDRDEALLKMYESGMSLRGIAEKEGINRITVRAAVLRAGEILRPRGGPTRKREVI